MRVMVIGCGAIGGYFGSRLVESGIAVAFVARGRTLQALRERGLHVETPNRQFTLKVDASDRVEELGPADIVLIAVKTWQLFEAAKALRPIVAKETVVVPLQNGVEAAAHLSQVIPARHVADGLCKLVAFVDKPACIRDVGAEPYIAFGPLVKQQRDALERLQTAFLSAGVKCDVPADIRVAIWEKFVFICAFGGVGALTRVPIGVFRSRTDTRQQLKDAMQEIVSVAHAQNVALPADTVARTLDYMDSLPAEATSSMQRDILNCRPSELEALIGAVVRLGRLRQISTPVHDQMYSELAPLEKRARAECATEVEI